MKLFYLSKRWQSFNLSCLKTALHPIACQVYGVFPNDGQFASMSVCRYTLQCVPVSVCVSKRQPGTSLWKQSDGWRVIISSETLHTRGLTDRMESVFSPYFHFHLQRLSGWQEPTRYGSIFGPPVYLWSGFNLVKRATQLIFSSPNTYILINYFHL